MYVFQLNAALMSELNVSLQQTKEHISQ